MKIKYQKQKGRRIKRYGWGIHADILWYDCENKIWTMGIPEGHHFSNIMPCKTVKAFKRALKKHPILRGRAVWINKYIGHDVWSWR